MLEKKEAQHILHFWWSVKQLKQTHKEVTQDPFYAELNTDLILKVERSTCSLTIPPNLP